MKIKHIPEDLREELHHTNHPVKGTIKESIHKSETWGEAKAYIQTNLEMLIYQAEHAIKKFCS